MTSHEMAMDRPVFQRPTFWWALFALGATTILTFVPYANAIQKAVRGQLGAGGLRWMLISLVAMATALAIALALRHRHAFQAGHVFRPWLLPRMLLVPTLLGVWMLRMPVAAEAFHLVEYALLGALAFGALSFSFRDASVYLAAAVLTGLIGTADEFIQWITPSRFWTLSDVALNVAGGVLAQVWIAVAWRPAWARGLPARGLWGRVLLFTAACLALATLLTWIPARSGVHSFHLSSVVSFQDYGEGKRNDQVVWRQQ